MAGASRELGTPDPERREAVFRHAPGRCRRRPAGRGRAAPSPPRTDRRRRATVRQPPRSDARATRAHSSARSPVSRSSHPPAARWPAPTPPGEPAVGDITRSGHARARTPPARASTSSAARAIGPAGGSVVSLVASRRSAALRRTSRADCRHLRQHSAKDSVSFKLQDGCGDYSYKGRRCAPSDSARAAGPGPDRAFSRGALASALVGCWAHPLATANRVDPRR